MILIPPLIRLIDVVLPWSEEITRSDNRVTLWHQIRHCTWINTDTGLIPVGHVHLYLGASGDKEVLYYVWVLEAIYLRTICSLAADCGSLRSDPNMDRSGNRAWILVEFPRQPFCWISWLLLSSASTAALPYNLVK